MSSISSTNNSRELVPTVIAEHGYQGIQHYFTLVQVSTSHINKNVLCVQCNFGVVTCAMNTCEHIHLQCTYCMHYPTQAIFGGLNLVA